jgi:hypothetical protein
VKYIYKYISLSLLKGIEPRFLGYPARSHVLCKKNEQKVKLTLEEVMKAQKGSTSIALLFL